MFHVKRFTAVYWILFHVKHCFIVKTSHGGHVGGGDARSLEKQQESIVFGEYFVARRFATPSPLENSRAGFVGVGTGCPYGDFGLDFAP